MPGNEGGDRIHNFLGQGGLSQGQHHSQVIDGTWPGLSNNLWVGSQRQVGGPLLSSLKNFGTRQLAESDKGHNGQSSSLQHGLNFPQSGLRPEISRSQSQSQSLIANGYLQGHQTFQATAVDSHMENGPDLLKKNLLRSESTESPVNYDFFGGQHQISGEHSGMIQPVPGRQSGMTEMQLLQQHAMLKQMQELQRQEVPKPQFQPPDARQLSSVNQVSSILKQGSGSFAPAPINGVPVHDASKFSWQPEHMTPKANWLQHGASPAMQGSSGGFMFSPEQGQLRLMGLVPQQVDQSIYGISTGGARGNPYQYSSVQMDKPLVQQLPASSSSFPDNQYAMLSDQVGLQDRTSVSAQGDQGRNSFGAVAGQDLNSGFHSENLQQMTIQQKNEVIQESCGRQHAGPSETSLEKSVIQAASSQSVAALDPTEEKILFGSDDSVWDIFGKSSNMGSMLDGTDSLGAFPSLQSGSWSALMQSAVAETSSNDFRVQEEWSGLGVQNGEPPSGNIPLPIVNDGSKQQSAWADNNLQTVSAQNSRPFSMSTDVNINLDFCSLPGVQQSGVHTANEQTGRTLKDSSLRYLQQVKEERSKWLDCSPLQKSAKSISGCQQGIAVYNPCGEPDNKPKGWNFIESASPSGGAISKSQDIESSLQPSKNSDHNGTMYEERAHGSGLAWPVPNANIESGNVKSGLGSPQVNRECSDLDNVAAITDTRTTRITNESSQQLLNSHNRNLWKSIDSKVNSGLSRVSANYQQNQEKSPQTFDSYGNNCLDKGASESNMLENPNVKENSNDSSHWNLFHHTSADGMRENVWLDVNDPQEGKQKSSVHIGRKPSITRKFQYHPMGDLDVEFEPSYGTTSVTHSQHVSKGLKGCDQGYFGQSKFTGRAAEETTKTEKGHFPGIQVDEVPSKSSNHGPAPDRPFVSFVANKTAPLSQNMLELLPKVDQSREHGTAMHLSSSERNQSSEMPDAETSDGSIGQFQHKRPSASQGFGLQLGPPSQRFTIPDRAISSQSSPQGVNSVNSVHVSSEAGRNTWLGPTTSVQSSAHGASHGDTRINVSSVSGQTSSKASQYNNQGSFSAGFTSDYPYLKSHLQSQHVTSVGSRVTLNESASAPFGGLASLSKQTDEVSERAQTIAPSESSQPSSSNQNHPGQQFPVLEAMPASQPSAASESPQQDGFTKMPNVWTSVSASQHLLGAQSLQASQNLFKPHHQSNINSETTLPGTKKPDNQISHAGGSGPSEFPAGSAKQQSFVGEEQPAKSEQVLKENDAGQNPATMQREIEAFGHSLRPNNAVHPKYSLLNQVQAMKNIELDPSNRSVKRFKGPTPDSSLDTHQVSSQGAEQLSQVSDSVMGDAQVNDPIVPTGDSKMLRFSSNTGDNREIQLSSNDMVAFTQNDSQSFSNANNSAANLTSGHSQISPQMAPSWFDRYGTFKNGQMLPLHDARKIAMMKAAEKAFIVRRPSENLHALHLNEQVNAVTHASQLDNVRESSDLMPIASEPISSHSLTPDITNKNLVAASARKRKSVTVELLPWHREVAQGSQRPQNISAAEVEWARAANRLIEKVENEPEMIEDWPPVLRSKRRLILTTQLIQQLLCAPPRVVLAKDASKDHETVAYFVARSVLGDVCSAAYIPESDTNVPPATRSTLFDKLKERNHSILKAAEEFMIRAKKLENHLQSLEKRESIVDFRVECLDLEKFSVINRFAKFHGRGQADGAEASSSSDAFTSSHRFFPQRYVTALPMPRNLPDRVQCLSL